MTVPEQFSMQRASDVAGRTVIPRSDLHPRAPILSPPPLRPALLLPMAPLCPVRILLTGPNRYVGRILRAVVLRQGHTMTVAVRDAARTRILLNVPITRRRDYPDY